MQHKKIDIVYLIDEMLKKWKMIVISAVILALLVAGFSYMSAKNQAAAVKYGAYSHIRICYNPVFEEIKHDEGIAERDFSDEIEAIIISDTVMDSVASDMTASGIEISSDSVRSALYIGYDKYGNNIYIDVLTSTQDMAANIASLFIDKSKLALEDNGYTVEIVRDVSKKGPVTIRSKEISTGKFQYVTTALPSSEISAGLMDIIKGGLFGALAGAFIMIIIVCVRFILKEPIVSPRQIVAMDGITLAGIYDENDIQSCKKILANILVKTPDLERVLLLRTGEQVEFLEERIMQVIDDVDEYIMVNIDNLTDNPMSKTASLDADETIVVIKAHEITVPDLENYCRSMKESGISLSAIFVK